MLFVYDANDSDCSVLNRWAATGAPANFYLDFKVFPGWSSCPQQPDGWHQYAPAQPHIEVASSSGAAGSFAISPGFAHAQDTASPGALHPHLDVQRIGRPPGVRSRFRSFVLMLGGLAVIEVTYPG